MTDKNKKVVDIFSKKPVTPEQIREAAAVMDQIDESSFICCTCADDSVYMLVDKDGNIVCFRCGAVVPHAKVTFT